MKCLVMSLFAMSEVISTINSSEPSNILGDELLFPEVWMQPRPEVENTSREWEFTSPLPDDNINTYFFYKVSVISFCCTLV